MAAQTAHTFYVTASCHIKSTLGSDADLKCPVQEKGRYSGLAPCFPYSCGLRHLESDNTKPYLKKAKSVAAFHAQMRCEVRECARTIWGFDYKSIKIPFPPTFVTLSSSCYRAMSSPFLPNAIFFWSQTIQTTAVTLAIFRIVQQATTAWRLDEVGENILIVIAQSRYKNWNTLMNSMCYVERQTNERNLFIYASLSPFRSWEFLWLLFSFSLAFLSLAACVCLRMDIFISV